jgi:hypothetical protein
MKTNTEASPNFLQLGQHLALDENLYERKTITRACIVINFDDLPFFKFYSELFDIVESITVLFVFDEITGIGLEKISSFAAFIL